MSARYKLTRVITLERVLPVSSRPRFYFLCERCYATTRLYKHCVFEDEPTEVLTYDKVPIVRCTPIQFSQGWCDVPGCGGAPSYWFYFKQDV